MIGMCLWNFSSVRIAIIVSLKVSFKVFKHKCIGSYIEKHLYKNQIIAPLDLSGSVDYYGIKNC